MNYRNTCLAQALLCAWLCLQHWIEIAETSTESLPLKPSTVLKFSGAVSGVVSEATLAQSVLGKHMVKRSTIDFTKDAGNELSDNVFVALSIDLFHRCADSHFCSTSANRNLSRADKTVWCCARCNCEDTCALTGTCCSDIQTVNDRKYDFYNEDPDTDCRHVSFSTTGDPYRFVTSCPGHADSELTQRCRTPGTSATDRLPVFDTQGLLNYKNRHCAACHGVTSDRLVVWRETLRCGNKTTRNSNTDELSRQDCQGSIIPPEVDGIQHTVCYNDIIGTCNITGQWVGRDAVVEAGCSSLQMYYFRYDRSIRRHFKNIFCALCNGFDVYGGLNLCPTKKAIGQTDLGVGFQFLLSHTLSGTGSSGDGRVCGKGREWDPLSGNCQDYHCSYPLLVDDVKTACSDILLIRRSFYNIPVLVEFDGVVHVSSYRSIRAAVWFYLSILHPFRVFLVNLELHFEVDTAICSLGMRLEGDYLDSVNLTARRVIVNIVAFEALQGVGLNLQTSNNYHKFKDILFKTQFNDSKLTQVMNTADSLPRFRFRRIQTDAWNLFQVDSSYVIRLPKGDNYHAACIYENVYTGRAVFCIVPEDFSRYYEADDALFAYRTNFLECPAFEYSLKDHAMQRRPEGLAMNTSGIKFDFGEFVSVNVTHVRICVESTWQRSQISSGSCVSRTLRVVPWVVWIAVCSKG